MKNIVKKTAVSTKDFVVRHKVGIALGTIIVLQARSITKHNEFLKEHELFNDFYKLTEEQ